MKKAKEITYVPQHQSGNGNEYAVISDVVTGHDEELEVNEELAELKFGLGDGAFNLNECDDYVRIDGVIHRCTHFRIDHFGRLVFRVEAVVIDATTLQQAVDARSAYLLR